jgi:hypothetical protein
MGPSYGGNIRRIFFVLIDNGLGKPYLIEILALDLIPNDQWRLRAASCFEN